MVFEIKSEVNEFAEWMVCMRRDIHMHPEVAFQEIRTASVIANSLSEIGIDVKTCVGETGVVGILDTGKPGPTLMIRADIDALPIVEEEGRPYGSETPGVMHA